MRCPSSPSNHNHDAYLERGGQWLPDVRVYVRVAFRKAK